MQLTHFILNGAMKPIMLQLRPLLCLLLAVCGSVSSLAAPAPATSVPSYTFENGDQLPMIGLGTWKSAPGDVKTAVKEAIKLGYRHIDCATNYANQKEVGEALKECFDEGIVERKDLWITSKLWNDSHEKQNVLPALKETLADLQLDYLDLYLIHWPISLKHGVVFPSSADEMMELDLPTTWSAMEELVDQGLVRHIGTSNFSVKKLKDLLESARIRPEVNQVERHPYLQQKALAKFCKENGIHITNYSSLGSGDRPDFIKDPNDPVLMQDTTVAKIAEKAKTSNAGVLLKWGLSEGASVIPKSVNPKRLEQNLKVAESVQLDDEDMEQLRAMDLERRYVTGLFWCLEGSPYTIDNIWDEPIGNDEL